MKAPFPYFGAKAPVANFVWAALGSPKHYIEPFFGSGAVLLARPNYAPTETMESVCDKDGFLANVWRAMQAAPEEVARWCDYPVNHADLNARRRVLLKNESNLLENLVADDQWCDPKMAILDLGGELLDWQWINTPERNTAHQQRRKGCPRHGTNTAYQPRRNGCSRHGTKTAHQRRRNGCSRHRKNTAYQPRRNGRNNSGGRISAV
jgi:hypothetical protein